MDRRTLLKAATAAGAALGTGGVLAACGSGAASPIPAGEPALIVAQASYEALQGEGRVLTFGVLDAATQADIGPAEDLRVYLRDIPASPDQTPEILAGPLSPQYAPAEATGVGVFYVETDLPETGTREIVAVQDGRWGGAAIQVVAPADSPAPVPGEEAPAAATPTTADDLGYFALCTQNPPCGMHEMSLDEALTSGRPVALLFATPAFCQTVVCGPSVATVERIRTGGDWGDTIFLHSEIFADEPVDLATATYVEAVEVWNLPSEPYFFTIDAEGVIQGRTDGPIIPAVIEDLLGTIST